MLFPRNGHWLTAWTRRLRVEGSVPAWLRRSAAGASLGPEFSAAPAGAHLLETPLPRRRDSWRGRAHDLLFPSMTARNRKPNGFDKKKQKNLFLRILPLLARALRASSRPGPQSSAAAPAGARHRARSRRPARPGRPAATVLVVGLLLLLGAAAAEAQTAPYVFAVSKVSADGTYNLGDTISLRVVFDVAVTVTGTPQLALNIGSRMRQADYVSGSGTATLVFSYEVVAGDEDTDGIGVPEDALTLNGGTISAGGTPANVTLGSASFSGLLVDGGPVAPTVTGVALTSAPGSDNTYAIGDAVAATVTFDAVVDITGSPQLELDFDGTAKAAACATGTNTTTMACSYTVVVGDVAAGGIAIAANKLTGGTIYATGSTTATADLNHVAVAIDASHKVDGIRPTLVTTGSDAPKTSTDGTKVILTFSEDISAADRTKITIQANSVTAATSAASVAGTKVELTLTTALTAAATNLTVGLAADAVDDDAGNGNLAVSATTVINAVPVPTVSGVALTSAPGSDNTYAIGDSVEATVTFDAAVDITGSPQLELDFAGTPKTANCTAATNTTTMVCSRTVAENDSAPNGVAIAANKLTGGTIYATGSTTVNAVLTHSAVTIDSGHKVDGIRPTLVTAGDDAPQTSVDGTQVIYTFSEDISSVTLNSFNLEVDNGPNQQVGATATISGRTVTVTLLPVFTIQYGQAVEITLATGSVRDTAGNRNSPIEDQAVTNKVPQPPAVISTVAITSDPGMDSNYATGDDIEVTATFDEAVTVTGTPRILLLLGGGGRGERWAEYASGSGTTAIVFSYPVVATDESDTDGIEVGKPSLLTEDVDLNGGTITVVATGEDASLSYAPLVSNSGHRVNWARPTLTGAVTSTDGTKVILTFSEDLTPGGRNLTLFTVKVGGTAVTLSGTVATVGGNVVTLTLATALTSATQAVTVSYAKSTTSTSGVEDLAGNEADSFTDQTVTNRFGLPEVSSVALTSAPGSDNTYAIGDAVTATVTFDAAVDISGTPQLELDFNGTAKAAACATGTNTTTTVCSYTVLVGEEAPNGVAIAANKLTGGTIYATGGTTVSADLDHVAVAIDANHKVDGIRPTLVTTGTDAPTTSTDGTKVILTFSEDIGAADRTKITIQANSVTAATSAESVTGTKVELTLTTALTTTATNLTVALAADAVDDDASNGILAVAATPVTNAVGTTTAPTVSGVALTSTPGADNTYGIGDDVQATVTFDAAADIGGTPQLELDFDGTAKAATCATGTNTTTMVCSYTVLAGDTAPNGIAIAANKLTGGTIYATGSTTITADLDHTAVASDTGHKVDGIRPTLVTTGTDAPTTSTDGTKVILTFSEDISAADRTKITIQANSVTAATSAESVTGTKVELTLTTALTTTATNLTVALAADAVDDDASNGILAVAATPVTNAVGTTTAPTVSGVALTSTPGADNTYGIGDDVQATVTFDAAADIGGTPQLELDFDGTAKAATCATGTNTTTMVCSYTVLAGDTAPNGVAIAANKLTGGTIYATGSTTVNADLDHSAVSIDADHKVDGIRPTLVTTGPDAPTTSADGETVLLVFSEDIGAVSHSDITIQANSVNLSTTMASVARTKVAITLTTALTDTTATLTVALAADAVDDAASNGILAVAATPVTNAVDSTATTPETPTNLSATPGNRKVRLTWTQPSGGAAVTHFEYELDASDIWISTGSAETNYTVMELTNGQSYAFRVRAANNDGQSSPSTSVSATPAPTAPEAPQSLGATPGNMKVELRWTVPADDGGEPITRYEYEQDGSGTWISTGSAETSYTVMELTNGQSYTFRVRAVNSIGGGAPTPSLSATPATTEPDAPESLEATAGDGQVELRWTAPPDDGGDPVTHYEYEQDGSGIWISTGSDETTHTVTGLVNGQSYTFRVRAVNDRGHGDVVTIEATPSRPTGGRGPRTTAPDAPRNLTAAAADGMVTLSWDAPFGTGGAAITDYEYQIDGEGEWISIGSVKRIHTITGLTGGTVHVFRVRAVNRVGAGRASDPAEVTLPVLVVLDFTHFANGVGITSEMVLVSVATHPIRPALYFYDRQGLLIDPASVVDVTMDLEVTESGSLTVRTGMEPLGVLTIATHGRGELVSGSVAVVSDGPLGGGVRYTVPHAGVTGVGASPPVGDVVFPARRQEGGIRTAASLHNLEEEAVEVSCRLMSGGVALEEIEISLEANGQSSWFIEEAFPMTDTSDFLGSVRCSAAGGREFTAIAIETDAAQGIYTTLPVEEVDRTGGRGGETVLDFAHLANGNWITDLVFVNLSIQPSRPALFPFDSSIRPSRPAIYFYDTEGNPIAPGSLVDLTSDLEVTDDGALTVSTAMKPLGQLHGRGELVTGSVRVVSEGPIGGMLRFEHSAYGAAGVGPGLPLSEAVFPVWRREGGITTGIALHNLEEEATEVTCDLMREGGVLDTVSLPLEANGQTSWTIDEAFPMTDTSDFAGAVRCSAGGGLFTALALEMDSGAPLVTALPVVAVPEVPSPE